MDPLQWTNAIIVVLGLPTILASFMFIGRKLQVLESLDGDITNNIKPDLKDVRERFAVLEGKTSGLFGSHSPISLTKAGLQSLTKSGLKHYIDDNIELLISACDHLGTLDTPYDVQQAAFQLFDEHEFPEDVDNTLKTYAFNTGACTEVLRRVGAIYFRDICLERLGFRDSGQVH